MSQQITNLARWKTITKGQCAFRSSNSQTQTLRCKHLFTNTSECHFIGCPIVQPNYVAVQRSYEDIFLVVKNPKAENNADIWKDQELPVDKEEALVVVNKEVSNLNKVLKEAVKKKFEHLYSVASTIRESSLNEDESEDSDLTDLETEE